MRSRIFEFSVTWKQVSYFSADGYLFGSGLIFVYCSEQTNFNGCFILVVNFMKLSWPSRGSWWCVWAVNVNRLIGHCFIRTYCAQLDCWFMPTPYSKWLCCSSLKFQQGTTWTGRNLCFTEVLILSLWLDASVHSNSTPRSESTHWHSAWLLSLCHMTWKFFHHEPGAWVCLWRYSDCAWAPCSF